MKATLQHCRVIDSFWLKLIALVTMTVDHMAVALPVGPWYILMRCIGRVAFPLYCFLLLEGFFHTRSRKKYLLRLLLLFLVSEPVYDLALNGACPDWQNQNILLTLSIGLGTVWLVDAMDGILEHAGSGAHNRVTLWVLKLLACALGLCLSEFTMADYGSGGILLILSFYFFRGKPLRLCVAVLLSLVLFIGSVEIYGLLALLPILLYSGRRGTQLQGRWMQYAFYLYYPAHIAVLLLLQFCLQSGAI